MYNIVAQYVIKVKTVPPGKRQSEGCFLCVFFFFFSLHFKGSLWQKCVVSFKHLSRVKSWLAVRARSGVNTQE